MQRDSIISALALNTIFGNKPKLSNSLISSYGSTEAVLRDYASNKPIFNDELINQCSKEYDNLISQGYKIISIQDPIYPVQLRECSDAPIVLYIRSDCDLEQLFKRQAVSIVGTRSMTNYGKYWCKKIVSTIALSETKPLIVSGLAYGVDICAHLAALEYGLPTVAVLPSGIDSIYPAAHRRYTDQIVEKGGAIISDYPIGTVVYKDNFLRRNRIIAGIGHSCIVVESKLRGGALMTARLALSYSRNVFAVPGRIDDLCSQGCNTLIARNMAACLDNTEDLLQYLGIQGVTKDKTDLRSLLKEKFSSKLPEDQLQLLINIALLIKKTRGICLDEICIAGNMNCSEVSYYVGLLENEKIITSDLFGNCSINI